MTKSELTEKLIDRLTHIPEEFIVEGVRLILDQISRTLANGDRIEIRGFGSFSLNYRAPYNGRNPKTGDRIDLKEKHIPRFKPSKGLRNRVNIYS